MAEASQELVEAEDELLRESEALHVKCGGGVVKQTCHINLSSLLQADDVGGQLTFEDGDLFDLQGVDVTEAEVQEFQALKDQVRAQIKQAVTANFAGGAEALKSRREELRAFHERMSKKRRASEAPASTGPAATATGAAAAGAAHEAGKAAKGRT